MDRVPKPPQTLFSREKVVLGYQTRARPGAGFTNLGNSCFLASTIQGLLHVPAFVNYIGSHGDGCREGLSHLCMLCMMAETFNDTQMSASPVRPWRWRQELPSMGMEIGRQEDAHEFWKKLSYSLRSLPSLQWESFLLLLTSPHLWTRYSEVICTRS